MAGSTPVFDDATASTVVLARTIPGVTVTRVAPVVIGRAQLRTRRAMASAASRTLA